MVANKIFLPSADAWSELWDMVRDYRNRRATRPKTSSHGVLPVHPHWGVLDADLLYNDTTGVTVSVWRWDDTTSAMVDTSNDIENVLPPPILTSGQLNADTYVLITRVDGRWFVTAVDCDGVS